MFLPALQWMRLGDPLMYPLWWLLAAYLAFSFPVVVAASRVAVRRWGVPVALACPAAWVAVDYARAHLMTGFAWYYLAHTQYRWLELIQICDITGAYGVTFVMTCVAAALAGLVPERWCVRLGLAAAPPNHRAAEDALPPRMLPVRVLPVFVAVAVCGVVLGYGIWRRSQAAFEAGPRVALIQGNFVASLRIPEQDYNKTFNTHLKLTAHAVRQQPDVIVWPEGMVRWPLFNAPAELSRDELRERVPRVPPDVWRDTTIREALIRESQRTGAAMIFGIENIDLKPEGLRPANSAMFVRPDTGITGRYDKMHLVPFGEYLPFQAWLPWLHKLTPYAAESSLSAGTRPVVFEYGNWRMAPVICFEDTVPHLVRRIVHSGYDAERRRPVDLVVNLTNDGWFHGSSELDQHLITAAFRAVELRTPVVRAVNTGISAAIDGDGAIRDPDVFIDGDNQGRTTARDPNTGRWHKQLNAAVVQTVPLDRRHSLYLHFGDWFAGLCAAFAVFWTVGGRFIRPAIVP
jgi:apolipoprotein N-acyltransferase